MSPARLPLLGAVLVASTSGQQYETWQRRPQDGVWQARSGGALLSTLGGTAYVLGGASSTGVTLADVWASSDLVQWTLITSNASWPARTSFGSCVGTGGALLVVGGDAGSPRSPLNDAWSSGGGGTNWTRLTSAVWPGGGRYGHSLVAHAGGLLVLGGFSDGGGGVGVSAHADVFGSTDGGTTWSEVQGAAPWSPRGFAAVATFNGRVYLLGGLDGSLGAASGDGWSSPDGVLWSPLPLPSADDAPWVPRHSAALIASAGVLWLLGGRSPNVSAHGGFLGDVWRSDAGVTAWGLVEATPAAADPNRRWGPRAALAAVATDGPGLGGIALASGLVYSDATGRATGVTDVWTSTANLLCEGDGVVCAGKGRCSGIPPPPPPVRSAAARVERSDARVGVDGAALPLLPDLPLNCSCDAGRAGPRCVTPICDSRTCVYGTCGADNATGLPLCVCNDPTQWVGLRCDVPVCAQGCSSLHGGCGLGPGRCDCEPGWLPGTCTLPDTWPVTSALWVRDHAELLFVVTASVGVLGASILALVVNVRVSAGPPYRDEGDGEGAHLLGGGRSGEEKGALASRAAPPLRSRHGQAVAFAALAASPGARGVGLQGGAGAAPLLLRGTPTGRRLDPGRHAPGRGSARKRVTFAGKDEFEPDRV